MWNRWNQTTHIYEKSDNDGASWVPLPLSATILNEGLVNTARLGSGTPSAANFLRGDQTWSLASSELPVGSLYFNGNVATNPATLLGYGTWSLYGVGRTIVCVDTGQAEFNTLGEEGGTKTHALTVAELAVHAHGVTDPTHGHTIQTNGFATGSGNAMGAFGNTANAANTPSVNAAATGISIQNAGSGNAHQNLMPYKTAYVWMRTA